MLGGLWRFNITVANYGHGRVVSVHGFDHAGNGCDTAVALKFLRGGTAVHRDRGDTHISQRRCQGAPSARVPALVRWPGRALPGSVFPEPISTVDFLPTILDALGLPPSEHAFGRSLIPELRGEALPPRPALSSLRSRPITTLDTEQAAVEHVLVDSLRTPEEKLIRRVRVVEGAPTVEELRWYDLASDPFELRPVGDPEDTRVRAAYDRLESEYAQLNTFYDRLPHAADEARSTVGQKWFSSQLEMLGYLDGDEGDDEGFSLTLPWGLRPLPPIPLER